MPVESGLQLYLNQINHVALLSADREKELAAHVDALRADAMPNRRGGG